MENPKDELDFEIEEVSLPDYTNAEGCGGGCAGCGSCNCAFPPT
ncbi:hypothetical protein [Priestia megaterium]|nr:hypothetical protein [Priestia megaterium]